MTRALRYLRHFIHLTLFFVIAAPCAVFAQEGQILSVTPPLFQLSVAPGDVWQSAVRILNGNSYELTVYAEVVNFAPVGERGQGKFIPVIHDSDASSTLADWIVVGGGPFVIPPEQSKEVSFFVDVPENADPGGHFAAIIIGTQPPKKEGEQLVLQTSQAVTSLFFVRIAGDVVESGNIREFRMRDNFVSVPEGEFLLRFENKGNVHLQPRGDIVITNMWGKERGVIPINQNTHFGNVLPETIREFNFSWSGERSLTDIGRYKAEVTLAYGDNGIKNTSANTYFWVIPIKATLITLGAIIVFILLVSWMIRMYVRRMLALAGVDVEAVDHHRESEQEEEGEIRLTSYKQVSKPLRIGARDFKSKLQGVTEFFDIVRTIMSFVVQYKIFFGSILMLVLGFVVVALYVADVSKEQRSYEVIIDTDGSETVVNSEEILKDRLSETSEQLVNVEQHFTLDILNASGKAGVGAEVALSLEDAGYSIVVLGTSEDGIKEVTEIQFGEGLENEAEALMSILGGTLVPLASIENGHIMVLVGKDHIE